MKRHIVSHFADNDIMFSANGANAVIPNQFRHLDLEKAEEMARQFRQKFADGLRPDIRLRGHSAAFRTKYTLLLATIGICDDTPIVEIPELSIGSELIIEGFKSHDIKIWEYSPEQIAACDRIGERGAKAIEAAEAKAGVTSGEAIYFTHAPISTFFALHLAGNPAVVRDQLLKLPNNKGDRFVVYRKRVTLIPLA